MGGIPISEKHGVNPTVGVCFYCNEESNMLALLGKLPGDAEAPRHMYLTMEPCEACQERRKTHIHLVVVKGECEAEIDDQRRRWEDTMSRRPVSKQTEFIPDVPRAGYTFWIDRDKIPTFVNPPELAAQILRAGWTFIPEEACDALGLTNLRKKAMEEHPDAKEIICRDADAPDPEDDAPCDDPNTSPS
jgi:hypothetical protein